MRAAVVTGVALALSALGGTTAGEYNCDSYAGSTLMRDPGPKCFCACDPTDVGSACYECPKGFVYDRSKNNCFKPGTKLVCETMSEPLECDDDGGDVKLSVEGEKAFCEGTVESACKMPSLENMGLSYQIKADTTKCTLTKKFEVTCRNLGKDVKFDPETKTCTYKKCTPEPNNQVVPLKVKYEGFTQRNNALVARDIDCPKVEELPPQNVFCGPVTTPYMEKHVKEITSIMKEKGNGGRNVVAWKQCKMGCATVYLKAAECAANNCDKGRTDITVPVVNMVKSLPKSAADEAVFPTMSNTKTIPHGLYRSKDNGALYSTITKRFEKLSKDFMKHDFEIDIANSISQTYSTFAEKPFAIDCRSIARNAVKNEGGIDRGVTYEQCKASCGEQYKQ